MTAGEFLWGPRREGEDVVFRLWAPARKSVALRLEAVDHPMEALPDGWHQVTLPAPAWGSRYGFVVDGEFVPDPASRGQASGIDGPSVLHDPGSFAWTDSGWSGRPWEEAVIYEMHVGAFTQAGTFRAAIDHLDRIADLGVTAIEIMPIAHFVGERGWGYDGVLHFAPHRAYGPPDDLKALVDGAHGRGLMVLLDVVYNHFGPEGNYLPVYAPDFFRQDIATPWGASIDFRHAAVRRFFVENALYWLGEFHLDGLRLDSIDQIKDEDPHILEEISRDVQQAFAGRHIHLVAENPENSTDLLAPRPDGVRLFHANWNDDFHHTVHFLASGEAPPFIRPYAENAWSNIARILASGFLKPGDPMIASHAPAPGALPPTAYIHFLQNHDQVGNRAFGERLHAIIDVGLLRLWTEILLLAPQIPMLFMGDEYLEPQPFVFFADYRGLSVENLQQARLENARNFGDVVEAVSAGDVPHPLDPETFRNSKLSHETRASEDGESWSRHLKKLLDIRREHIVPLLGIEGPHEGRALAAPDGTLAVDWNFGTRRLCLRANLTDSGIYLPAAHGLAIHGAGNSTALPDESTMRVFPKSVCMFLGEATG